MPARTVPDRRTLLPLRQQAKTRSFQRIQGAYLLTRQFSLKLPPHFQQRRMNRSSFRTNFMGWSRGRGRGGDPAKNLYRERLDSEAYVR
jgi:hypothetical protein